MQAKIIDFASEKVVNSLKKIEKDDVKRVVASVHSKFQKNKSKKKENSMKLSKKVTSTEKYCENMKEEFNFYSNESTTTNEKKNEVESSYFFTESSDGKALKLPLKLCKFRVKKC